jgi:alpha-glucosidase
MQWANQPNAGFCPAGVKPWLPVHLNYDQGVNVADQMQEDTSLLQDYRRLLAVRKSNPALVEGDFRFLDEENPHILTYLRWTDSQTCLVMINFKNRSARVSLPVEYGKLRCVYSTHRSVSEINPANLRLNPYEVLIAQIDQD